jgi:hypothetical protein
MHKLLIILFILVVLIGNVAITSQKESALKDKEAFIAEVTLSRSFEYQIIEEYLSRQETTDMDHGIKMVLIDQDFNVVLEGTADHKLTKKVQRESELLFQISNEHYYWQKR